MIGDRIKSVRKFLNLLQNDLAVEINVKGSAISQMESGKIKPSLDTILLLNKRWGVDLHWLLTGEGTMFQNPKKRGTISAEHQLDRLQTMLDIRLKEIIQTKDDLFKSDVIDLEVMGEIAAGAPLENQGMVLDVVTVRRDIVHGSKNDFICLRVNGQSMEPEIKHGDAVLIRQSQNWEKLSGRICAVRIDGSITLKKMTLDDKRKTVVLLSLNDEFKPIILRPDEHQDIVLLGYLYFLFRRMA